MMTPRARYHLEQLAYREVRQGLDPRASLAPLVAIGLVTRGDTAAASTAAEQRAKFDDRLDRTLRGEVSGLSRNYRVSRVPRDR